MEILTGKCKKDFEKWYKNNPEFDCELSFNIFIKLPLSMQYEVYVDFFESKDILFTIKYKGSWREGYIYEIKVVNFYSYDEYIIERGTLCEMRKKAIELANALYNDINK